MLPANWGDGWSNVWLGVTTENKTEAMRRTPILQATPAAVRFLSAEPLLEPITPDLGGIAWVICGGESGSKERRPVDLQWMRSLRDQCSDEDVAFFAKQVDGQQELPPDLLVRQFPHRARE
jgi:protein gp37